MDSTIKEFNKNRFFRSDTLLKIWKLILLICSSPFYDIVVIQRTRLPKVVLYFLKTLNKNLVYDFDDALFVPFSGLGISEWSDSNKDEIRKKFFSMLPYYKLVIAGNSYLAEKVRPVNSHISVIPTPVDTSQYTIPEENINPSPTIIGWVGAGEQHIEHLRILLEPIRNISKKYPITIRIIGAMGSKKIRELFSHSDTFTAEIIDSIPQDIFIDEIKKFTIGVMPLVDDEWSRGKCGYKALLYMACGVPTIASPVGVNKDIIEHGESGFLASTNKEWEESIEILLKVPEKRFQMGLKGRDIIEKRFSQRVCEQKLFETLSSIIN
ncbi:MAG: glycosyltransferase family 4 protein [Bacteroidota bacterium]|nr:glycosyltransferase family 4 protein [Bacteroidota bacterium]